MCGTIGVGILDERQGTWIQLPSGVRMGSAPKDRCGDVGASLVRESPAVGHVDTIAISCGENPWSETARSWETALGDCLIS